MLSAEDVHDFVDQFGGQHSVPPPGGRDQVIAHLLLVWPVDEVAFAAGLELGVLKDVVGSHAIEYELGLVGHPDDVVLHRVTQKTTLVDQLDEGEAGVLL